MQQKGHPNGWDGRCTGRVEKGSFSLHEPEALGLAHGAGEKTLKGSIERNPLVCPESRQTTAGFREGRNGDPHSTGQNFGYHDRYKEKLPRREFFFVVPGRGTSHNSHGNV